MAARLQEVVLRVGDIDRVGAFYSDVLGLHRRADTRTRVAFTGGAEGAAIVRLHGDPEAAPRQPDEAGLFHLAIRVPDRYTLSHVLWRLETHDYPLEGAADHLVSEALYMSDPAGNGVEVYYDRPRSAWEHDAQGCVVMDTRPLDLDALRELTAGETPGKLPVATELGHVHLEVTDLEASSRFYEQVLGLELRAQWRGARFLAWGGYHHHVALNTWRRRRAPAAPDAAGLGRITALVDSHDDLQAIVERARAQDAIVGRNGDTVTVAGPDAIEWTLAHARAVG